MKRIEKRNPFNVCLWLLLTLLSTIPTSSVLAQTPLTAVGVYYVGVEDAVAEAINFAAPYIVRVDQPELAQVLVFNDFFPHEAETARLFATLVQRGDAGVVIFCGAHFPKTLEDLSAVFGVSAFGIANAEHGLSVRIGSEADPLQRAITWDSAPPLQARTVISNANLLLPIVTTTMREPVIQRVRGREGPQAFIVGGWLGDPSNHEWQHWSYFRYLVYRLIAEAADSSRVLPFSAYPLSPVPQGQARLGMMIGGGVAIFLAFWTFYLTRRRLFLHPELWENLRPTTSFRPLQPRLWETVGFHRPLAGLLTLWLPYFLTLGLFFAYQMDYLPRVLIPWAHTLRLWQVTESGLAALWLLVDMGTGIAAVYYFATVRIRYPHEAFRYFQGYVWWQWLSGAVQFGGILLLATLVLPGTALAYLAFYVVAHALIRFPGFFQSFRFFFRAVQRLDYEQYLAVVAPIGMVTIQSATVWLLRRWGMRYPIIGETTGSILGLGVGVYLTELLGFILGLLLYKSLGYSLRALFLPTFDRQIIARVLSFGGRLTFGAVCVPLGALAQLFLLPRWLPAYNAIQSHWTLALAFAAAYEVLATGLYSGLLPAMAEAHIQGYKTLLRYYISQGLHYGLWFSLFLFVALRAVGAQAISSLAGVAFGDVISWLAPVLLWGVLQWGAWFTNQVLIATGRPAATSWLTIIEQGLRLGLMAVFVPARGMVGLPAACAVALALRLMAAWYLVYRHTGRIHIYVWRTIIAPAVAAWAVYVTLRLLAQRWGTPTYAGGVVLLGVALLPTLALYGFITALLGGWDDGSLAELQRATRLSGVGFPLAWLLLSGVRAGVRLSPLHGRFPAALRVLAEEEAQALTWGRTTSE